MRMLKSKLLELKEREREEKQAEIAGDMKKIEWGSQIRSYVFHPYSMVKDHRTGVETGNIQSRNGWRFGYVYHRISCEKLKNTLYT